MTGGLIIPPGDDLWASLPTTVRDEVRLWITAFESVPLVRPIGRALNQIAQIVGQDYKTVERKYYQFKKTGTWRVFVDGRRTAPAAASRVMDPRFQSFWKKLCEDHKRTTSSAIDELYSRWRKREEIPGYEGWPGWPNIPEGWSQRSLYRYKPSKTELCAFRIGMSKAAPGLSQVFSTRVGLWCMSHVMFDDVWHDHMVKVGERSAVGRVLELNALCVHAAYKLAWGCKPRLPKVLQPDQMEGLKERNMRLLVAKVLFETGYSPRGTILMAEHGTAAIRERVERVLHDSTGGLVSVRRSGITGEEQGVLASWKGEAKGNPRFKAPLESLHNLIHNRLDALPGQTGPDRNRRPEILADVLRYQDELMELAKSLPPARQELLIHPLLEYHSQFLPLLIDLYAAINARTNHRLEGWEKCGFVTTDYRLAPNTDQWLDGSALMALPDVSRHMLIEMARTAPDQFSRTRKLSPAEAFSRGSADLLRVPPHVICDLLAEDMAREEKVKGAYFRFADNEIDPEELIYEARVIAPGETRQRELPEGEKYLVFVNPFSPDTLFVLDSRKALVGLAQRVRRVNRMDDAALLRAFGRKSQRDADRMHASRMRHAEDQSAFRDMVANNQRVADLSRPVTPEEKDTDSRIRGTRGSIADLVSATDHAMDLEVVEEEDLPPSSGSLKDLF